MILIRAESTYGWIRDNESQEIAYRAFLTSENCFGVILYSKWFWNCATPKWKSELIKNRIMIQIADRCQDA